MKKEIKGFVAGVLITAFMAVMVTTAIAAASNKTITVTYSGIKVSVDGSIIEPKDVNGNPVEPFSYNGTTYLPARAVAEAVGRVAAWDAGTNTVNISEHVDVVTVGTAEEFVKAIGSNKKIILEPGTYNLSDVMLQRNSDNTVEWRDNVYDSSSAPVIQYVRNLTIEGSDTGKSEFVVDSRYSEVLNFAYSSDITIKNITAGHTPAEYTCNAGVFKFEHCRDVSIGSSEFYGCGSIALELHDTSNFNCDDVDLNHCSFKALFIADSTGIHFTNSVIREHEAYSDVIYVENSRNVTFTGCDMIDSNGFFWSFIDASGSDVLIDRCKISNNTQPADSPEREEACFFKVSNYYADGGVGNITVRNTEISGNRCDRLTDRPDAVTFENCTMSDNTWEE